MHRVVIIGYGTMFTNLIAGCLDAGCEIVGVFRKDSVKNNFWVKKFKDIINPDLEYNYIKSYNLPEIEARSVNSEEFKNALLKLNPDIILVGSWCEKLSKDIYNLPRIATINAHPSLLPNYRGPNPYFWTIRNREKLSGISFHLVDENYDTGSILAQEIIEILPDETGATLKEKTVIMARKIVCELLKDLKEDIIIPLKQSEEKASYYSHPKNLLIDFHQSSEEISCLIRACYPWCKPYFYHKNICLTSEPVNIEITENTSKYDKNGTIIDIDIKNQRIKVLCNDNKVINLKISLYNRYDSIFTKNYMRRDMRIGQIL